jgi:hypothetical protein
MKTLIRTCHCQDCEVEVPESLGDNSLCLEHYMAEATQRLYETKDSFDCGQGVDRETFDWLLAQVDLIVEMIGNESLATSEDQRSKLLQLLLGIANLNECIHHPIVVARKG